MPKVQKAAAMLAGGRTRRAGNAYRVQLDKGNSLSVQAARAYAKSTWDCQRYNMRLNIARQLRRPPLNTDTIDVWPRTSRKQEVAQMPCLLFDPSLFSASEMSRRIQMVNVVALAVLHALLATVLVLLGYVRPVLCCTHTGLAAAGTFSQV